VLVAVHPPFVETATKAEEDAHMRILRWLKQLFQSKERFPSKVDVAARSRATKTTGYKKSR
jgi:hypothetical protein